MASFGQREAVSCCTRGHSLIYPEIMVILHIHRCLFFRMLSFSMGQARIVNFCIKQTRAGLGSRAPQKNTHRLGLGERQCEGEERGAPCQKEFASEFLHVAPWRQSILGCQARTATAAAHGDKVAVQAGLAIMTNQCCYPDNYGNNLRPHPNITLTKHTHSLLVRLRSNKTRIPLSLSCREYDHYTD